MNTNVLVEITTVEQTTDAPIADLVELSLADLDVIGGGSFIGVVV
jgi:hypothetical protein